MIGGLAQQVLSGLPFLARNATTAAATTPAPLTMPTDLSSLIALLFSFSALRDWLKLVLIGGVFETCRRLFYYSWNKVVDSFWITAQFHEDDASYGVWLFLAIFYCSL
jgi:mitochondrial chaperone BCS1